MFSLIEYSKSTDFLGTKLKEKKTNEQPFFIIQIDSLLIARLQQIYNE